MIPSDQLSRVAWALFSTLTFASKDGAGNRLEVPGPTVRSRMLFHWLRKVAKLSGVPIAELLWVAREEQGEAFGRYHFHVLVGVPASRVLQRGAPWTNIRSYAYACENVWRYQCGRSAGIADVRPYCSQLSGVQYILKGLDDYNTAEANNYEVGRFSESGDVVRVQGVAVVQLDRQLISARALVRELAMRSRNRRLLRARDLKLGTRDRCTKGTRSYASPARLAHPYAPEPGQGLM